MTFDARAQARVGPGPDTPLMNILNDVIIGTVK